MHTFDHTDVSVAEVAQWLGLWVTAQTIVSLNPSTAKLLSLDP